MYQVPTGWKFYGAANNGDQTTFTLPGHSVSTPHLVIFDRRVPVSNNGNGYTTPSYRVRVIRGFLGPDNEPLAARVVVDATIRWPMDAPLTDVKGMVGVLGDIFSSTDFATDAVDEQQLPRSAVTV